MTVTNVRKVDRRSPKPSAEELSVLSRFERFAFHLVTVMNQGHWKRFWTWCQRVFGAGWIHLSTYNIMNVYGLEHIEAVSHDRPILLVANHRSFFDMYTVSTVLFRHTKWRKQLFFPVRGRFFYQSPLGLFVAREWCRTETTAIRCTTAITVSTMMTITTIITITAV